MRPLLVALLLVPTLASAGGAGTALEVWTRRPGSHVSYSRGRDGLSVVDLTKLPQETRALDDVQLKAKRTYRGVPLSAVFAAAPAAPELDLALLHFKNGMVVPVPLRDEAARARLGVFIATAVEAEDGAGKRAFTTEFPALRKSGAEARDRRPIFFDGNKVVVATRWHPLTALEGDAVFSPWAHVDRLEGVEYAKADAYWAQFAQGETPELKKGLAVFQSRCGFCHGLSKVGATFGWDYVEPIAVSTMRTPNALVLHARYREGDAPERGLMMPGIKEFTDADAKALWKWIDAAAKKGVKPYQP